MALFSGLSEKLNHIFSKLAHKGRLTELEIKTAMREIRIALLEADVNISVVKDFVAKVSERAVGQEILKSLTPAQQVIKIVNEKIIVIFTNFINLLTKFYIQIITINFTNIFLFILLLKIRIL